MLWFLLLVISKVLINVMLLNGMEEVITGFKPRPPESLVWT